MLVLLPLVPGVAVVPDEDEVPPALEPVVMPSSFRHLSRSEPTMPRHLLLEVPELPLLPDTPEELVPGPEELVPGLEGLPVAPALLPVPPYVEPVPCASDTPESAKSAAAVAAQMSFKVASLLAGAGA